MIFRSYIPSRPLFPFMESFFYFSGFEPVHRLERFLPDGNVHLILDLTDTPKYIHDNDSLREIQACKNAWFSGFRTAPITIPSGAAMNIRSGEIRLGMDLGDTPFNDTLMKSRLTGPMPRIPHMAVLRERTDWTPEISQWLDIAYKRLLP